MTTEITKFSGAYATMTVAVYEPIIVKWVSGWGLYTMADALAWRLQKGKHLRIDRSFATAQAINVGNIRPKLPRTINPGPLKRDSLAHMVTDHAGNLVGGEKIRSLPIDGLPGAVGIGDKAYPYGVVRTQPPPGNTRPGIFARLFSTASRVNPGNPDLGARTLPTMLSGSVGVTDSDFEFSTARKTVFLAMTDAVKAALTDDEPVSKKLRATLANIDGLAVFEFFPFQIEEALSPIGIAHFYRQLYFNAEEGVGPIEEAFTVAPNETLEVVYEAVRRQIHEEVTELGSEIISEKAIDEKNLDEVSDKTSSMIQRDSSASMSANASGSIGVWQAGATASASFAVSSQRGKDTAARRLKEVTQRASERITKTFRLKVRDVEDVTTTNLTRRVISNPSADPVAYGLRRVMRKVRVKVQDLGPSLVWQLYVRDPGSGLARSRFVHFREAEPIAIPDVPPGMPSRPKGGTDTGTTNGTIVWHSGLASWATPVVVHTGTDRRVTALSIDSISDLEGGGKDDDAPSALNTRHTSGIWDSATNTFSIFIAVNPGDSSAVSVNFTYAWEPSQVVLDEWETERKRRVAELQEEAYAEQFDREKTLITERSKIRQRPANDLRREERYEVMNRMVSHLFLRGDDPSEPAPLEIEYFHRFFEIDRMFVYTHPSWWKPRYSPVASGFQREAYEITAESEPAPLGSSLSWSIQVDGDARRNEFLNSPWVRVCLPMRRGREREAVQWLAKHVEGEFGYDPTRDPLKSLLGDIDTVNKAQDDLGVAGPDWVKVDSTVAAPDQPLSPEGVYPLIDAFEVTVPTDGFIYDSIVVTIP